MQNPNVRRLLVVLAGVVLGGIVVALVEGVGHAVFPPPAGVDLTDPEQLAAIMDTIPVGAKLFVVLAWLLGSLSGGWAAVRAAGRLEVGPALRLALVVGTVLLLFGAYTLVTIPHPLWMAGLGILLPLPSAWLGARLAGAV
jgi:hypothetical protein